MYFLQSWLQPISLAFLALGSIIFVPLIAAQEPHAHTERKILSVEDYKYTLIVPLLRDLGQLDGILNETHGTPKDFEQPPGDSNLYVWGSITGPNIKIVVLEEGNYVKQLHTGIESYPKAPRQSLYLLLGDGASQYRGWDVLLSDRVVPPHIDEVYLAVINTKPESDEPNTPVYQIYSRLPGQGIVGDSEKVLRDVSSLIKDAFGLEARKAVLRFCYDALLTDQIMELGQAQNIADARRLRHASYCLYYLMYHAEPLVSEPDMEEFLVGLFPPDASKDVNIPNTIFSKGKDEIEGQQQQAICDPLCHAAAYGFERMAHFLIHRKAEVNKPGGRMGTPLQGSIYHGHLVIARSLLENGADPNLDESTCAPFSTALNNAIFQRNREAVQLLLEHRADANIYSPQDDAWSQPALAIAVGAGDVDIVQLLLKYGASISQAAQSYYGGNIFAGAAMFGGDTMFHQLVEYSQDQDIEDKAEMLCSALVSAAANGWTEHVKQILNRGANVNCCTVSGSPLSQATSLGHVGITKILLDAGATAQSKERYPCNAILSPCHEESDMLYLYHLRGEVKANDHIDRVDSLRLLLEAGPVEKEDLNEALFLAASHSLPMVKLLLKHGASADDAGPGSDIADSALYTAILNREVDIVQLLLENGAQIREPILEQQWENSHPFAAIYVANATIMQLLMDHGADITSIKDYIATSAYAYAAFHGHADLIKLLLLSGADVNALCSNLNDCPLHLAIWNEHTAIVEILLQAGADPNRHGRTLPTPLQMASGIGNQPIVEAILRHGGDPNVHGDINSDGVDRNSSLLMAITYASTDHPATEAHVQIAKQLLDHGADITYQDGNNQTLLEAAIWSRGEYAHRITEMLLERGADIHKRDQQSRTIVEQAASIGNFGFLKLIIEGPLKDMPTKDKVAMGEKATFLAAKNGHKDVLGFLLQHHFPLNCSLAITCPLRDAVKSGHIEVVEVLLDHANEFNIHSSEIEIAFSDAIFSDRQDFIKLFVERKIVDLSSEFGSKMLSDAIRMRKYKVAHLLTELGAVDITTHNDL